MENLTVKQIVEVLVWYFSGIQEVVPRVAELRVKAVIAVIFVCDEG